MVRFKNKVLTLRINEVVKTKLCIIAENKKLSLTKLIDHELLKLIKKENKNESN